MAKQNFQDADLPKTEFNSSVAILNRLNLCCVAMDIAQNNDNLVQWQRTMEVYFKELAKHMTKEDYEEYKKRIREIRGKIPKTISNDTFLRNFQKTAGFVRDELMELETDLGVFQEKKGLGMKLEEDASKATLR